MTPGIYIGSTSDYAGKNTLSVGMGLRLKKEGYNPGYMKPLGALPVEADGLLGDEDAFFVQDVLGITPRKDLVTPVLATQDFKIRAFNGEMGDPGVFLEEIRKAYAELGSGHDLMITAGSGGMFSGLYCGLDAVTVIRELGLKAVIVDRIVHEVNYDLLLALKNSLGESFAGVVLNAVPPSFIAEVESLIRPFLERKQIRVLGVLPQDPLLGSIRAAVLAEGLGGRIIAAQRNSERIVEDFLIGTMQVENFIARFRSSSKAAVIVGGDRADVQLVAIEGNCSCLVLTGNLYPNDIILSRAEALNVPVIIVRDDTNVAAKKTEMLLSRHKLRDAAKISQIAQLVSANLDFHLILQALGL
ncbi:MAG: AAA family ATPase [Deltaproteobacteria bacterium]|jgi:BioD-like phosphotransacetylase family protein|nr:AAA family ATPase [Deltaproteobacteria bacterium]